MTGQTEDRLQHDHYLGALFLLQLYNRVLQCSLTATKTVVSVWQVCLFELRDSLS